MDTDGKMRGSQMGGGGRVTVIQDKRSEGGGLSRDENQRGADVWIKMCNMRVIASVCNAVEPWL